MSTGSAALELYHAGPLTVIGFYGRSVLEGITVLDCRNELEEISQKYSCTTMAFDLTNLKIVPSGLLGLFASIKKAGIDVLLFKSGTEIKEVLKTTRLDTLIELFDVDVAA